MASTDPFAAARETVLDTLVQKDTNGAVIRMKFFFGMSVVGIVAMATYLALVIRAAQSKSINPFWIFKTVQKKNAGNYLIINTKPIFAIAQIINLACMGWFLLVIAGTYSHPPTKQFVSAFSFNVWTGLMSTTALMFSLFQSFLVLSVSTQSIFRIPAAVSNSFFIFSMIFITISCVLPMIFSHKYFHNLIDVANESFKVLDEGSAMYNNASIPASTKLPAMFTLNGKLTSLQADSLRYSELSGKAIAAFIGAATPWTLLIAIIGVVCILFIDITLERRIYNSYMDLKISIAKKNPQAIAERYTTDLFLQNQAQKAEQVDESILDMTMYPPQPNDHSIEASQFGDNHSMVGSGAKLTKKEIIDLWILYSSDPHIAAKILRLAALKQTVSEFRTLCIVVTCLGLSFTAFFMYDCIYFARDPTSLATVSGVKYEMTNCIGIYTAITVLDIAVLYLIYDLVLAGKQRMILPAGTTSSQIQSREPQHSSVHQVDLLRKPRSGASLSGKEGEFKVQVPFTGLELADNVEESEEQLQTRAPKSPIPTTSKKKRSSSGLNRIQVSVVQEIVVLEDRDVSTM